MAKKLCVALLAGGRSGERAVSVKSGDAVYGALDKDKYEVRRYDPRDDLDSLLRDRGQIDIAFILLHGRYGEDGSIQGFLETIDIPYVGSGVLASAVALHKKMAKSRYELSGITVPGDMVVARGDRVSAEEVIHRLGLPVVVKPVTEGSSLGISVCRDLAEVEEGIELGFGLDREVMVEEFIQGVEVTCCVVGNEALETLPVIEIVPGDRYTFFDYEAKYTPGATEEICPARIPEDMARRVRDCACSAHRALKCSVWSRTDMIVKDGNVYALETNTIPGMTENSLVPRAARAANMSLGRFADLLIRLSLEREGKK